MPLWVKRANLVIPSVINAAPRTYSLPVHVLCRIAIDLQGSQRERRLRSQQASKPQANPHLSPLPRHAFAAGIDRSVTTRHGPGQAQHRVPASGRTGGNKRFVPAADAHYTGARRATASRPPPTPTPTPSLVAVRAVTPRLLPHLAPSLGAGAAALPTGVVTWSIAPAAVRNTAPWRAVLLRTS